MLIVVHYIFNLFICLEWLEGHGVHTDKNLCLVPIANSSLKGSSNWDDFI